MNEPAQHMRRMLRGVLFLGMLGVGADLLLTEHYEALNQLVPLIALGVTLVALGWDTVANARMSRRVLRIALLGLVASGIAGCYLHYESNEEFKRELDPSLDGWHLVLESMRSHSPPSLAPGVMGLLGAIGWIATLGRD